MKLRLSVVTLFIFLLIISVSAQTKVSLESSRLNKESLRPEIIPVRSINPTNEDFSDLMPLKSKIGNARVVVLGEGTHSEGSTSAAKSRIVRFLHQKMGFDILAWESGLFQTYAMNSALKNTNIPLHQAKYQLISGVWANEKQTNELFKYARASWKTDKPLEMSGFDGGKPYASANFFRKFFMDLGEKHTLLKLSSEDWKLIGNVLTRGYGFISSNVIQETQREKERAVLQNLQTVIQRNQNKLLNKISERQLIFAERFIYDALMSEELKHIDKTKGGAAGNIARDKFMADTFLWAIKNLYPKRKVIIWAATAHLIRNGSTIENLQHNDWYPTSHHMGHHVYQKLGDDLYTIAFTSYGGEIGTIYPEESKIFTQTEKIKPPLNSFEAVAHQLNEPYFFVDLRGVPKNHWLKGKFLSVALGKLENEAVWSNIIDAFFFIDEAEPIEYMPKPKADKEK